MFNMFILDQLHAFFYLRFFSLRTMGLSDLSLSKLPTLERHDFDLYTVIYILILLVLSSTLTHLNLFDS